jgi:hypothetical protein
MAQMLPLADSFSFLLSKLPMLNAPSNLSGLQLSSIQLPLLFPTKLLLSVFCSILLRSSEHSMSFSFALLPQLLFLKLQPTPAHLCRWDNSIPSSPAVDALCLLNLQLFVRCLLVLCPTTVAVWICSTVDGSSSSPNGTNAAVGWQL